MAIGIKELKKIIDIQAVTFDTGELVSYVLRKLPKAKLTKNQNVYWGPTEPRVLIVAHLDEVGFRVSGIKANGLISIEGIGWVKPILWAGQTVQVKSKKKRILTGLVAYKEALAPRKIKRWADVMVDLGFSDKLAAQRAGIGKGCYGTYEKRFIDTDDKIIASSLDNRLGVWLLLRLVKERKESLKKKRVGLLLSIDEEENNKTAKQDIKRMSPAYVIALDVLPHSLGIGFDKVGQAPWILYQSGDYKLDSQLKNKLIKAGQHGKLSSSHRYLLKSEPYKYEKMAQGSTKALNLLIPVINYHHNLYSVEKRAVQQTYNYLLRLLRQL